MTPERGWVDNTTNCRVLRDPELSASAYHTWGAHDWRFLDEGPAPPETSMRMGMRRWYCSRCRRIESEIFDWHALSGHPTAVVS